MGLLAGVGLTPLHVRLGPAGVPDGATPARAAEGDMIVVSSPLFELGAVTATPAGLAAVRRSGQSYWSFIARHLAGDWGNVDADDRAANNRAVEAGERLLSSYTTTLGEELWVLSEADRSATTLLLPSDY